MKITPERIEMLRAFANLFFDGWAEIINWDKYVFVVNNKDGYTIAVIDNRGWAATDTVRITPDGHEFVLND
jgi:hypothetical protein